MPNAECSSRTAPTIIPSRDAATGALLAQNPYGLDYGERVAFLGSDRPPQSVYFLTIDKAKFRRPVVPGDTIKYHMTRIAKRKTMWWFRGEARVDGELVCEAEVGAMIAAL